jgi:hypothetical protein
MLLSGLRSGRRALEARGAVGCRGHRVGNCLAGAEKHTPEVDWDKEKDRKEIEQRKKCVVRMPMRRNEQQSKESQRNRDEHYFPESEALRHNAVSIRCSRKALK